MSWELGSGDRGRGEMRTSSLTPRRHIDLSRFHPYRVGEEEGFDGTTPGERLSRHPLPLHLRSDLLSETFETGTKTPDPLKLHPDRWVGGKSREV